MENPPCPRNQTLIPLEKTPTNIRRSWTVSKELNYCNCTQPLCQGEGEGPFACVYSVVHNKQIIQFNYAGMNDRFQCNPLEKLQKSKLIPNLCEECVKRSSRKPYVGWIIIEETK
ncbi:unnamed protein product [Caretta caretta]